MRWDPIQYWAGQRTGAEGDVGTAYRCTARGWDAQTQDFGGPKRTWRVMPWRRVRVSEVPADIRAQAAQDEERALDCIP